MTFGKTLKRPCNWLLSFIKKSYFVYQNTLKKIFTVLLFPFKRGTEKLKHLVRLILTRPDHCLKYFLPLVPSQLKLLAQKETSQEVALQCHLPPCIWPCPEGVNGESDASQTAFSSLPLPWEETGMPSRRRGSPTSLNWPYKPMVTQLCSWCNRST